MAWPSAWCQRTRSSISGRAGRPGRARRPRPARQLGGGTPRNRWAMTATLSASRSRDRTPARAVAATTRGVPRPGAGTAPGCRGAPACRRSRTPPRRAGRTSCGRRRARRPRSSRRTPERGREGAVEPGWANGSRRRPGRRGRTRWLASSSASATVPSASRSANGGHGEHVGRCRARPRAAASSALVTGSGATTLTGPGRRRGRSRTAMAATSSSVIQLIHCRPDPRRPPTNEPERQRHAGQDAAVAVSTVPLRRKAVRMPASAAAGGAPPRPRPGRPRSRRPAGSAR